MQISIFKRERLRIIGLYLIIILAILIFALSPLNNSVEEKKTLLNEYLETYRTKAMLVNKKKQVDETVSKSISEQEKKLLTSLFPKDSLNSEIQIKTLKAIIKSAKKNGLSMIDFQLPDYSVSKDLSEVSVLVRLQGMPDAIMRLLKDINKMKTLTDVKNFKLVRSAKQFILTLTLVTYKIES